MTDEDRSYGGLEALCDYIGGPVSARLDEPGDDLLSALVAVHRADDYATAALAIDDPTW